MEAAPGGSHTPGLSVSDGGEASGVRRNTLPRRFALRAGPIYAVAGERVPPRGAEGYVYARLVFFLSEEAEFWENTSGIHLFSRAQRLGTARLGLTDGKLLGWHVFR